MAAERSWGDAAGEGGGEKENYCSRAEGEQSILIWSSGKMQRWHLGTRLGWIQGLRGASQAKWICGDSCRDSEGLAVTPGCAPCSPSSPILDSSTIPDLGSCALGTHRHSRVWGGRAQAAKGSEILSGVKGASPVLPVNQSDSE